MLQDKDKYKGGDFEDSYTPFSDIAKIQTQSRNLISDISGTIKQLSSEYLNLITAQEGFVKATARQFGGIRDIGYAVRENVLATTASAAALGISGDELLNVQKGLMDGLHTSIILNKSQLLEFGNYAQLFGKTGKEVEQTYSTLIPKFLGAGVQMGDIGKNLQQIVKSANEYGVATEAVFSVVEQNIHRINQFKFENGVKGLTDMAAKSTAVGIDLTKQLDSYDALIDLQKAQERINYMSFFDPEYGKKVGGAIGLAMMAANDKDKISAIDLKVMMDKIRESPTGQLEFTPAADYFMRVEKDKAANLLPGVADPRQAAMRAKIFEKVQDDLIELEKSRNITLSDELINSLKTKAQYREKTAFVDLGLGKGEQKLSEVATEDFMKLQEQLKKTQAATSEDITKKSKSDLENATNNFKSFTEGIKAEFARITDINKLIKPFVDTVDVLIETAKKASGMKTVKIGDIKFIDTSEIGNRVKKDITSIGNMLTDFLVGKKGFSETVTNISNILSNTITNASKKLSNLGNDFSTSVKEGLESGKYSKESFETLEAIIKRMFPKEIGDKIEGLLNKNESSNIKLYDNTKTSTETAATVTPSTSPTPTTKADVDFKGKLDINVLSNNQNISVETLKQLFDNPILQSKIVEIITKDDNFVRRLSGMLPKNP